jgi:hypothetical protein
MFNVPIVEVAIGISFMYLVVSLFCTAVQEWAAQLFNMRAHHLEAAIKVLLTGDQTTTSADANAVLGHPLVKMLDTRNSGAEPPDYIPAGHFAAALAGRLVGGGALSFAALQTAVDGLANNPHLRESLKPLLAQADGTATAAEQKLTAALTNIEAWYDSAMDHASGWYKRNVRAWLLLIGGLMAMVANADTVQVGQRLADDAQLRAAVTALAAQVGAADGQTKAAFDKLQKDAADNLQKRDVTGGFGSVPVGWDRCPGWSWTNYTACYRPGTSAGASVFLKLFGLLLTAIAAAMGAPFWFGLLQQFNAIRSAGPKPSSSTTMAKG